MERAIIAGASVERAIIAGASVERAIIGFERDPEGHWVARLACGHGQHVRHQPPFLERPWVLTAEGRATRIGTILDCRRCDHCE